MNPKDLTDTDVDQNISSTSSGVVLFHKKLCPHCLNMKKVIDKFTSSQGNNVDVFFIDSEENPNAMQSLEVERVPTLLIIKNGKICARKTGLMNPRELKALYASA